MAEQATLELTEKTQPGDSGSPRPGVDFGSRAPVGTFLTAALIGVILVVSYWDLLRWMSRAWASNPDYSHGYLVPLFSLGLLWLRRERWSEGTQPTALALGTGVLLILFGGTVRALGSFQQIQTLQALSLLPCLAGAIICWGGWNAIRFAGPSVAFLVFMIPLPGGVSGLLSGVLQSIATVSSTLLLKMAGIPAFAEGNVIWLSEGQIGVAEACSGLRMLMSFVALAAGACLIVARPLWEKIVVLLSVPIIAIVANVVRITTTGIAFEFGNPEIAERIFHDLAGWLMMPLGLAILFGELWILSRLILPETRLVHSVDTVKKPVTGQLRFPA